MTTPHPDYFRIEMDRLDARRAELNAQHEAQQRKRALAFWRIVMIAFVIVGFVAAFALGVAVMVGAL